MSNINRKSHGAEGAARRKVQCWIFSRDAQGRELCLTLKTNAARGQFWQPVTGTVEDNEGYFEAACREAQEETGFTFATPPVDTGYEFEFKSRFGPAKERIFGLYVDDAPVPKLDPREHDDYQWVTPNEASKLIRFPSNREGLVQSFKRVFGKEPAQT